MDPSEFVKQMISHNFDILNLKIDEPKIKKVTEVTNNSVLHYRTNDFPFATNLLITSIFPYVCIS